MELKGNPNRIGAVVLDVELPADGPEGDRDKLKNVALRMPPSVTLWNAPRVDIEMY